MLLLFPENWNSHNIPYSFGAIFLDLNTIKSKEKSLNLETPDLISENYIIITLFQEDNIYGMHASLIYGPHLQR